MEFKSFKGVQVLIGGCRLPLILPINSTTTKRKAKRTMTKLKAQSYKAKNHQQEAADSKNHCQTDLHNAERNL